MAHAQDATWNGASTDWTDPNNWNPNTVPTGTATFTNTGSATVDNANGFVTIGATSFTSVPNAQAYTFNIDNTFIINGAGVTNSSTNTQTFNVDPLGNAVPLIFQNSATANNGTGAVIYNNSFFIFFQNTSNAGNTNTTFVNNEIIQFNDTSSAGTAHFTNNVQIDFLDSTSAGGANITNNNAATLTFNNSASAASAVIGNATGGTIGFTNTSTAGSATITNAGSIAFSDSATAGSATITNNSGGTIDFNNTSTSGVSQITNNNGATVTYHDTSNAGTTVIGNNSTVAFVDSSSAGSAGITTTAAVSFSNMSTAATSNIGVNSGGSLAFNDTATAGSANITTSISSATITFNNSSSAGSANITNNSTAVSGLTFNNSSTAGSAAIQNNGTTNFNNSSTAGTAQITNGSFLIFNNSADAGSATITNNSALIFNNSASANSASITSNASLNFHNSSTAGSASITLQNGGSAVFADTSSGGTAAFSVVTGSALDISLLTNGGTTAGSIAGGGSFFLGHNTLTVGSLNTSTTVSGQILDGGLGAGVGGSLDKVGTGTLTLSNAANLYQGATTVDGGTLSVTGSIALSSGVAINSGGTLNGTGAVSAISVNAGGTLMPGLPATVGTLQATSVTFASGASYLITINGATNSKVTASGAATLNSGATVKIASGSTINSNQTYAILTATGGVTGQFNPNVTFGAFKGTLSYDAHDVFLTFAVTSMAPLLPPGAPINVVNVANAIDNFVTGGGMLPPGFTTLAMLSQAQLENALTQLSGELGTGAQLSGFQLMNQFMSLLLDPLADGHGSGIGPLPFAPAGQQNTFTPEVANAYASVLKAPAAPITVYGPWRAWGAAFGGSNSITGDPNVVGSHDVRTTAGGFAAGLDYRFSPNTVVGVALAGAATGWNVSAGLGSGNSDAFQAGLYAKHQFGAAYLAGALAFSNHWESTTRTLTVAGTDTLKASFDAQSFGGRLEGGYRISLAPVTITPYAALQAQSFRLPGYAETAASGSPQFALSYAGQTSTAERGELGTWLSRNLVLASGDTLALFGRAAWAHDWFSNLALTPSFQALPGASFVVNGAAPPHDLALVTAGAEWRLRSNWSVMGRFDGEFGDGQQTYTGTARLRYVW